MVAGFGNDRTAPGMADQEKRAFLHADDPMSSRHIIRQRTERILNSDRLQPALRERRNDLCPARAVGKSAMHENDGSDCQDCYSFVSIVVQDLPTRCDGVVVHGGTMDRVLRPLNNVKAASRFRLPLGSRRTRFSAKCFPECRRRDHSAHARTAAISAQENFRCNPATVPSPAGREPDLPGRSRRPLLYHRRGFPRTR